MKRLLLLIFSIVEVSQLFAQTVSSNSIESKSNLIYHNGALYTGNVVAYNSQGQLISKYEVKEGAVGGTYETFYESKEFAKDKYQDTAQIFRYTKEIQLKQKELIQLEIDSSQLALKINDFINYNLGGSKKVLKMRSKNEQGKLNKKDKVLFDELVSKELEFNRISSVKSILKSDIHRNQDLLSLEYKKPKFEPVKQLIYEVTSGKKNGKYVKFSEEGKILEEGNYINDKQEGEWKYFYSNGILKATGKFAGGDGGNLGNTGIPKNGRESMWKLYHENGNLSQESYYVNGESKGTFKLYFENGNLKEESQFVNGEADGKCKFYYDNGKLKQDSQFRNGKLEGVSKLYYENGKLNEELHYVNGNKDGAFKFYYENGKIQEESRFLNGNKDGTIKIYYENGKLKSVCQRSNGKLVGKVTTYYENGKIEAIGHADPEDPEGNRYFIEKSYSNDGTLLTNDTQNNSNINALKQKHSCEWCGRSFTGLGWFASESNFYGEYCQAQEKLINLGSWFCSKKCATEDCIRNK